MVEPWVQLLFKVTSKQQVGETVFVPWGPPPSKPYLWQVTADAAGKIVVRDHAMTVIGMGRWKDGATQHRRRGPDGRLLDDERWDAIDALLRPALDEARSKGQTYPDALDPGEIPKPRRHQPETPAPNPDPVPDVQFLVTVAGSQLVDDSVRFGPAPELTPLYDTCAVTIDSASRVTVRRNLNGQIAVVATGRWMPDVMRVAELQPTIDAPSMPPIEIAIGRALQLRTAIERPPTKHAVSPTPPKRKRGFWKKVGSAIGTFFVIVGAILWTCLRLSEDKRPNGTECDFDSQCASDNCARGPDHTEHCRAVYDHNLTNGSYCYESSECQSGYCNWQNACVGR